VKTAWPVNHQGNHAGQPSGKPRRTTIRETTPQAAGNTLAEFKSNPIYIHTKSKLFRAFQNMTKNNL